MALVVTFLGLNPAFATKQKNRTNDTPNFDQAAELIEKRYTRTATMAELIIQSNLTNHAQKFLLKTALKVGAYDEKPMPFELIKKDNRLQFRFKNKMTLEIKKTDGSVWINSERLRLEKIEDIDIFYDEIFKILSKKEKFSKFDLILPKAQAVGGPAIWAFAVIAGGILIVSEAWEFIENGCGPMACTPTNLGGAVYNKISKKVKKHSFPHLFLTEYADIREIKCIEVATPGALPRLMPREVVKEEYKLVEGKLESSGRVVFYISYDGSGQIKEIVDSKNRPVEKEMGAQLGHSFLIGECKDGGTRLKKAGVVYAKEIIKNAKASREKAVVFKAQQESISRSPTINTNEKKMLEQLETYN
ncbi:MAG: hypothetical protein AABY53_05055 [Bdellovibrionota bacterium]